MKDGWLIKDYGQISECILKVRIVLSDIKLWDDNKYYVARLFKIDIIP